MYQPFSRGIAHDFNNLLTVITGYSELIIADLHAGDPLLRRVEEIRKAAFRAATLTRQLLAFGRKQVVQPAALSLNSVISDLAKMLPRLIGEDVEFRTSQRLIKLRRGDQSALHVRLHR